MGQAIIPVAGLAATVMFPAAAPWIAAAMGGASAIASASQQRGEARNLQLAAAANAKRQEAAAKATEAAGIFSANEERRKAGLLASRALAVASASGAGGIGAEKAVVDLLERGEKNAGVAMYEALERGRGLRDSAAVDTWKSTAEAASLRRAARNTLMTGAASAASSLYSRFGAQDAPKTAPIGDIDNDAGYSLPLSYRSRE